MGRRWLYDVRLKYTAPQPVLTQHTEYTKAIVGQRQRQESYFERRLQIGVVLH